MSKRLTFEWSALFVIGVVVGLIILLFITKSMQMILGGIMIGLYFLAFWLAHRSVDYDYEESIDSSKN